MNKDMRKIIKKLRAEGWRHEQTGKDHIKLIHPSGLYITASLSPSCCFWRKKVNADIKRLLRGIKVEGGPNGGSVRQ